jgi:ubiquinone/menaquinone biosynthesis C-methylase UbiE
MAVPAPKELALAREGDLLMRLRTPLRLTVFLLALVTACSPGTAGASEAERIAEVLELSPGMVVADVGAGDGEWSAEIARRVGDDGRVWATEVDADDLAAIRERVEREGLGNVSVVRGDQTHSGLPAACCDAILLRLVYHHFTDPPRMRAELRRALRPGGRLVVVDIEPQTRWRTLKGVPDRGGHGIHPQDLIRELTSDGFEVIRRVDRWNGDEDRYCVVFQRP